MAAPERFFFVHLQKTGGTALFQRLRDAFGPDAVYPGPDEKGELEAVIDVDHLQRELARRGDEVQVITGHFPLCVADVIGGPLTTFTILRHPVERTLSALRRRQAREPRFQQMSLEAIYEDEAVRLVLVNHMVRMLSLTPEEMTSIPLTAPVAFDAARLERAKGNLERVDVVGVQEHFDDFCAVLERRLGRPLGPSRFANRTAPQPVPDGLRERISVDNELDVDLYDFAAGLRPVGP